MDEHDELFDAVREVYGAAVLSDIEEGVVRPGAAVLALLDIGCLGCSEASLVRGIYGIDHENATRAFLLELERLEIPREDVTRSAPSFEEFQSKGGSWELLGAPYVSVEHGGDRRLALMMGVLRG